MQIMVNDQLLQLSSPLTLQQLLKEINQPDKGVALAVNRQIISRNRWSAHTLLEGDEITLIKATAGG
ncbi:thiamine biosynthesis protein ThiS [Endozoicomonas sp. OPT23]|nr:thiamine biosynthesis protein ThiS [Endozoicomonas sp. OPT23]